MRVVAEERAVRSELVEQLDGRRFVRVEVG